MNGHTAAVKLLLDMGSDINAQVRPDKTKSNFWQEVLKTAFR